MRNFTKTVFSVVGFVMMVNFVEAQIISTVAGNGNYVYIDSDIATSASLNIPIGVVVDAAGNLYIANWGNHRIRKVNSSGIISTVSRPKKSLQIICLILY
jgi:DNA-binding beta-propeller fold protein YncE